MELDGGEEADGAVDAGAADAGPDAGADAGPDAGLDAGADGGAPDAGDAGPTVVVYPTGRTQSPMTSAVAAGLRASAARGAAQQNNVFAKVGDSHTVSTNYLACFAGANVELAGRTPLQPTIDLFKQGVAGTTTPFNRVSLAAGVGW